MSTKKFTVIDTRTMQKKSFDSQATTVAELKADLRKLGITTDGMVIQEGLTKTELKADTALLPHDVPYKGGVTNNLVFRLTQAEKKIKSGADMSRADAYAKVKELNLAKTIAEKFGKNFTMCKTSELIAEIEAVTEKAEENKSDDRATQAIFLLTSKLVDNGVLSPAEGTEVVDVLIPGSCITAVEDGYSSEELEDMFDDM